MTIDECISAAARRASRMLRGARSKQGMVMWQPLVEAIEEECGHVRRHFTGKAEGDKCARQGLEQIVLMALILYSTSELNKNVEVPDHGLLN